MLYSAAPMRKLLLTALLVCPLAFPQASTPSIAGVWKADLEKSKIPGPPNQHITNYLSIFEEKTVVINRRTQEKGPEMDELTGIWGGPHGDERQSFSFLVTGKPAVRPYMGVPTEMTANWQGNVLTLTGDTAGRPQHMTKTYELSTDGQTLTVTTVVANNGREQTTLVVLNKQPDSAGDPLRQPEVTAGVHYKNVKTDALKDLPASEFIDRMHYFSWALDKNCEFCHVQKDFSLDDKKEKKTAREMIDMTAEIDAHNFKGRPNVQCFTCHGMHQEPLRYPLFPDQIAAMQAAQQQQHPGGPGAGGPPPQRPPQ